MGCIPSSHDHHQQQQVTNQPQKRQQKQLSKNDQTIIELKIVRDKLTGKEQQIEKQMEATENSIKQLILSEKRERAKFQFEKKKLYQKYLDNIQNKAQVLQKMILEVQQAEMDKDCTDAMKNANNFLKDVQKAIDIEQMQDVQADLQENQQQQEQFDQLFENYGIGDNKEELEEEYKQLEAQLVNDQFNQNKAQPQIDQNLVQKQQENDFIKQQQQQQQNEQQQQQQAPKQQQEKKQEEDLDALLA